MPLINKNCYHALALKLEDYVYSKCIEGLNLSGITPFTFSIQFLPTASNHDVILFKQEGTVEIGWRKGQYYYKTPKAYVTTGQGELPFSENIWNQLDISFDKGVLTFYMSGMEGTQETITGDASTSTADYHMGQGFEGYIRYIRIANMGLSQKEIVANQYKTVIGTDKLELYFDFTQFKEKDLGKNNLKILITGLSEVKDIVRALMLDENGIAIPSSSGQINPGGFASKQFSIYQRIFLESGPKLDRIILGNGSKEKGLVLEVTADFYVKILWNGTAYQSQHPMALYQWIDLTITYDSSTLKIYYNGLLDASYPILETPAPLAQGNLTIGNILMNGRPLAGQSFRGFIDMVAIFEKAVEDTTLLKFAQESPYIYETGLSALFFFHDDEACEELHSGIVTLSQGANLSFAENTLRIEKIEEISYNLGETKGKYTDFELWEATSLAMAITAYIETQSSLKPTIDLIGGEPLKGGLVDRIIEDVLVKPEAQALLSDTSAISASEVGNLLKVLQTEGKLMPILKSLYGTAFAFTLSSLVETIGLSLLSEYGVFILGGLALCALAALLVNKKQPEPPAPTPPSPDPGKKYRYLQVKAIQFQMSENIKESAIPLAETTKKAMETPEWQCEKNKTISNPSIEAYISGQVTSLKIEVTFVYATNYTDSKTLHVSAKSLGETALGAIDEFDLEVALPGVYKKTVNLTQQKIKQIGIGQCKEQYNWTCKETGFLGTSYHLTHLLPKSPCAPWSLKKAELSQNITIGALEFFDKVNAFRKDAVEYVANNLETASQYVHYLLDSDRFAYPVSTEPQYSEFKDEDSNEITFDQDKFDEAEKGDAKIELNCLDCNLVVANMAALQGEELTIVNLASAGDLIKVKIGDEMIEAPPPILFKETRLIGETEWKALDDIEYHFVAVEGECDNLNALIYDGCLLGRGTQGQSIYATGLVFTKEDADTAGASDDTTYRETYVGEGASCIIDQEYTFVHGNVDIQEEEEEATVRGAGSYLSSQINLNSVYDDNGVITINSGGRFPFDARITNYMKVGLNQNRCHSVSYDTICTCVSGPLNGYLKSGYTVKKVIDYLKSLTDVVFINGVIAKVDDLFKKRALDDIDEIEKILKANAPAAITGAVMTKLIGYANSLIASLNNAISNLRLGNTTWNQSVSNAFDVISWWYVNGAGKIIADSTTLHYMAAQNVPVNYPPCTNKGFYITDNCDGRRLYAMLNNTDIDSTFGIYKAREVGHMDGFIYSSSNQYAIPNALANTDSIYYLYNGAWVLFS